MDEEQHETTLEDLHVVLDHGAMTTVTTMVYQGLLRHGHLVRDLDHEMTINGERDPDLETILRDVKGLGQEMMTMLIGVPFILVDYDPNTHLAINGQHMRKRVHLQK